MEESLRQSALTRAAVKQPTVSRPVLTQEVPPAHTSSRRSVRSSRWRNRAAEMPRSLFRSCPEPAAPCSHGHWQGSAAEHLRPALGSGTQLAQEPNLLCPAVREPFPALGHKVWLRRSRNTGLGARRALESPNNPGCCLAPSHLPSLPESKGGPLCFCTALGPWEEESCFICPWESRTCGEHQRCFVLKAGSHCTPLRCTGCPRGAAQPKYKQKIKISPGAWQGPQGRPAEGTACSRDLFCRCPAPLATAWPPALQETSGFHYPPEPGTDLPGRTRERALSQ